MSSRCGRRKHRLATLSAGLLLVTGALACDTGGPDLGPSVVFVRGVVTAPDGSGVPQAQVLLEVRRAGESVPIGREPTGTDATGVYEILLGVLVPPFDGRLDVYVTPPDTTVLRPASVLDRPARFNPPASRDTVRVNVALASP